MRILYLWKKHLGYLIICSLLLSTATSIALAGDTISIQKQKTHQTSPLAQEMDITIYGSHYMKVNTPFNYTNGLYVEFIYHGNSSIILNASVHMRTISTYPSDWNQKIAENFELTAEATAQTAISYYNFGIGFFSFTLTIDGSGANAGQHYQKTAYGVCFHYRAFVIFQK